MIKHELKRLRAYIDARNENIETCVVARIAYAMETAIMWATEDTEGWPKPFEEALSVSSILLKEIGPIKRRKE